MSKHKTFFGKIFGWIGDLFHDANQSFLETAVTVTQTIKNVLSSPVVDIITGLIPSNVDNSIVSILRDKLPLIIADELLLRQFTSMPADEASAQAMAKKLVDSFGGLSDEKKEEFYTSVAAKIYILLQQAKSGVKVTFGQAAALVESAYQAWLASNIKDATELTFDEAASVQGKTHGGVRPNNPH